jgi:hypothetical protein
MTALSWDGTGEKVFETGVDHGVLYIPNESGVYDDGVAWNGLTNVTESPTGAEQTKTYADNIIYGVLTSVEEFEATLTCYTYPPEFEQFDGLVSPVPGVKIGQQLRRAFGFGYRTLKGNDVAGMDLGYKLHLAYGLFATPSEKSYDTVNDSPEMAEFSYDLTSIPTSVTDLKPTSLVVIDSTEVGAAVLEALELILYGDVAANPALPTPDEVLSILGGTPTATNVTVAAATDAVAIGGTTTNVRFTVEHWDGNSYEMEGENLSEAGAEALVLVTGDVYRVTLSATANNYVPAAQQKVYYIVPT